MNSSALYIFMEKCDSFEALHVINLIKMFNWFKDYTSCRWKWTILSPPSSVLFSILHIHWSVASRWNSRSASQKELYPVSGSVSCPELTSTASCAFAFSNRLSRLCQNPVQNVCEQNCVSDLVLFSSVFYLLLTNRLFRMAYWKLKAAIWWEHKVIYSVNFQNSKHPVQKVYLLNPSCKYDLFWTL